MNTTRTNVLEKSRIDSKAPAPAEITVVITPIEDTLLLATTFEGAEIVDQTELDESKVMGVLKEALGRVKEGSSVVMIRRGNGDSGSTSGGVPPSRGPRGDDGIRWHGVSTGLKHLTDLMNTRY